MDRDHWLVLEPLLDHALELTPAERQSWLSDLRVHSPELAAHVTRLLDEERVADDRGFLEEPPEVGLAGLQLGAYTLERPLGAGGMGSVWLARRTDGRFEGHAAVKLLNLALLTARGRERFRREGSMLARLSHPGIARLLDAGVSPQGQPYLVLEHVDGERIDIHADTHHLSPEARIRLVLQVLAAVAHAHANLVVHRDLKPSNILVTADGTAKLLDFGIAKLVADDASGSGDRSLTVDGRGALTPEFAAPEQLRGDAVTTATDVYACGVLLYLLLSGRHPTAHGRDSSPEAMRALLEREPARLGLGDLDLVLAKALRKNPSERYESASAFATDLERYLRHEPVSARAPSLRYRAGRFLRRNRTAVTAASIAATGLVAAMLVAFQQLHQTRLQRDRAVFEERRADAEVDFQNLMLTSFGAERLTTRDIVDRGAVLLRREYAGDPAVAASLAISLGERYSELDVLDRQAAMLTLAESLAVRGHASSERLRARCERALNLQKGEHTAQATALADSVGRELASAAPLDAASCLQYLAEVQLRRQRFDTATVLALHAARLLDSLGTTDGAQYVDVMNTAANALEDANRGRAALAIYRRLATVLDSTGRGMTTVRNVIRNNIGIALTDLGEMTAALPILHGAMTEYQRTNPAGEVHPAILINYCKTVLFLRQLDSASTWYERLYRQSLAHGDAIMAEEGADGMAQVELMLGRSAEAARWTATEKALSAKLPEPRPVNGLELDAGLARLRGDVATARAQYRVALQQMGYDAGKRPFWMRSVLIDAAETALAAGVPAEALTYAREARRIATADSLTDTRSAYVGEARLVEARALLASDDAAAARGQLTRALVALRTGAGPNDPRTLEAGALLDRLPRS